MTLKNEEWKTLIDAKVGEIQSLPPFAPAASPPSIAKDIIALAIDHTLLKPDATPEQIDGLCDQALQYKFTSCCVNGAYIAQVSKRLDGSSSIPCCVVGETGQAIEDGAKEIDMVINIGALKSGNYALVFDDIKAVVREARGYPVKVILETVFLSEEEKIAASFIAAEAGASFVKTCTGFLGGGALAADVAVMKRTVEYKGNVQVKASAGIRSLKKCLEMLEAGADRIGTSSGVTIMHDSATDSDAY
ncbi:hypothetical protein H0H81_006845 [Sphagnurus paluster]|uniref:deoxyribose-phosphate aldolase n=1 Tax=Sphagnurus paluster TaxID=117069 RepID=A0A9P7FXS6_9AGAR|nr:hypothetical protein H0H81_006845 [Sphagnurus paluster]